MLRRKANRKIKSAKKNFLRIFFARFVLKSALFVGAIYIVLMAASRLTHIFLSRLSYFNLSQVCVKDHLILEGEDAFEFAGLKAGVNIFDLDLYFISQGIKHRHPEYDDVIVQRILPNRIAVLIRERTSLMQIKFAKFYPVDKNGFVIPYAQDSPYSNLPLVIGIEPREAELNRFSNSLRIKKAIDLITLMRVERFPWHKMVYKINLTSLNDISLFLDNDIEVKIGADYHLERLRRLGQVLEEIKIKSLSPSFIDLRFKDVIISPI